MAATYDSLRALSRQTMKKLLDVQEWRKFLAFASRSFKLPFPAQVLAYAQRPDAAALMKSSDWEAVYGRPVKKGCHGVPVPEGRGKKLVYYYDIADTRETDESRPVPLWHVRPENQKGIGKALESYLGKLEDASGFAETLLAAARKATAYTIGNTAQRPAYVSRLPARSARNGCHWQPSPHTPQLFLKKGLTQKLHFKYLFCSRKA